MKLLVVNVYIFRRKNTDNSSFTYWRCSELTCGVKATTNNEMLTTVKGIHNHSNDLELILKYQLIALIKESINLKQFGTSFDIYNVAKRTLSATYNYEDEYTCLIPSFDSMKSNIYRYKEICNPNILIFDTNEFNYEYFNLPNNRNMHLYSDFEENNMIILGDPVYINRFSRSENFSVFMDGTFKSATSNFLQIYIIHGT